jgi:nondiscriminating glutamyl-tRNA synthetase
MGFAKVRVRYAPSPTGYLHIGGARSALFNYLFAKKYNGDFVFRIEDTDIERNIPGAEYSQLHDLLWLNIIPDESIEKMNPKYAPYRQTEKIDLYRKYAQELIDKGYAYECFCTEEELDQMKAEQEARGISAFKYDRRCLKLSKEEKDKLKAEGKPYSIRIKVPEHQTLEFDDLVRGKVSFNSDDIGDFVIIKSNGIPTYNFAVVIDDHIMDISHVFRGEEHLSNTPKQMIVYNYFGWEMPQFGHMTIIINQDGKKLSKRDHNILQFMSQYRDLGYLPAAIDNFILLLGWTPDSDQEIFSLEEAIKAFDPKRLSASPSMFDPKKLDWLNGMYIRALSDNEYLSFIKPFILKSERFAGLNDVELLNVANMFKKELVNGAQISTLIDEVFVPKELTNEELDYLNNDTSKKVISEFLKEIVNLKVTDKDTVNALIKSISMVTGVKGKDLYMPLRFKITGRDHGLEMYNIITLLGIEETAKRLGK